MVTTVWRTILGLWLASVLLVISFPGAGFDATPHWENVQWIPFTHLNLHNDVLVETALNILAFVPVGYLSVRSFLLCRRHPVLVASFLGFVSSFTIEVYQLFCQDRVPSTSDILTNVAGTAMGAWLAVAIDQFVAFCTLHFRRLCA